MTLQQAENGKLIASGQIEELKQWMGSLTFNQFKGNDLSVLAGDKCIAESLSLGMRSKTLSKNLKTEVSENILKIMAQTKLRN